MDKLRRKLSEMKKVSDRIKLEDSVADLQRSWYGKWRAIKDLEKEIAIRYPVLINSQNSPNELMGGLAVMALFMIKLLLNSTVICSHALTFFIVRFPQ